MSLINKLFSWIKLQGDQEDAVQKQVVPKFFAKPEITGETVDLYAEKETQIGVPFKSRVDTASSPNYNEEYPRLFLSRISKATPKTKTPKPEMVTIREDPEEKKPAVVAKPPAEEKKPAFSIPSVGEKKSFTLPSKPAEDSGKPAFSLPKIPIKKEEGSEQPKPAFSFPPKPATGDSKPAFSLPSKPDSAPPKPAFSLNLPPKPSADATTPSPAAPPAPSTQAAPAAPAAPVTQPVQAEPTPTPAPVPTPALTPAATETQAPALNPVAPPPFKMPAFAPQAPVQPQLQPLLQAPAQPQAQAQGETQKPPMFKFPATKTADAAPALPSQPAPAPETKEEVKKPAFGLALNQQPSGKFSFGQKTTENGEKKPGFSFGASKPGFSFGAAKPAEGAEPAKPAFSFGASQNGGEPKKPFQFNIGGSGGSAGWSQAPATGMLSRGFMGNKPKDMF